MKANELMIGDWVLVKHLNKAGRVYRIDTANGKGNEFIALIDGDFSINDIEPIPLTPEILEKNGFKFESPCINDNKDAWVYEWPHEKPNHTPHVFLLMSHHNKARFPNFWICAPNDPDIVYVHQLQHALRLCGIEKEIEL